jgi:integration host factor subunit beta
MTKNQLVSAIAIRSGVSRASAERVVNVFFDAMRDALLQERRIEIRGLGSLKLRHYLGHRGTNPRTRTMIQVGPKVLPVFRMGKEIRDRLNQSPSQPPPARDSVFPAREAGIPAQGAVE